MFTISQFPEQKPKIETQVMYYCVALRMLLNISESSLEIRVIF